MGTLYRVILAFHVIGIIAWMAGILYLYRLFVYHAEETENLVKERFKIMEQRLYRYITLPAAVVSLFLGMTLVYMQPSLLSHSWLHIKLTLVIVLLCMTVFGGLQVQELAAGPARFRPRTYRILNEIPTLLMMAIVLLVILKP